MRTGLNTKLITGTTQLKGDLGLHVVPRQIGGQPAQTRMDFLRRIVREGLPTTQIADQRLRVAINKFRVRNMRHLLAGAKTVMASRLLGLPTFYGALSLTPIYKIGTPQEVQLPLGLVGFKVVTTVGVGFIVDAFQGITELEIMKHHGLGTGTGTEDPSETSLVTELSTEYTGNIRAVGNLTEGASANIFHTEATNTLDGTPGAALREHGIFSATTGGVLLDRTLYAAISLSAGDGLLSKYELTLSAGS